MPNTTLASSHQEMDTTKIRTEEPHQHVVRYWDRKGGLKEPPANWRRARLQLRFHVSHLWIMASGFGLTVNVLDVLVESEEVCSFECPF